jgi:tetratricopeptide (TPR) repeat protein
MKTSGNILLFSLLLLYSFTAFAQTPWIDSVKKVLATQKADTTKVFTLISISNSFQLYNPDSSFAYGQKALALAEKLNYDQGIFWSVVALNGALIFTGNYPLELEYCFKAVALSQKINDPYAIGLANGMLSDYYYNLGDYNTSLTYWQEVLRIVEQSFPAETCGIWANLSRIYNGMHQPDSALLYAKKAYDQIKRNQPTNEESYQRRFEISIVSPILANAFASKGIYDSALFYYHMGIPVSSNISLETNVIDGYNGIAVVYQATGKLDSAVWYAKKALTAKIARSYPASGLKAANLLSAIYESKNKPDSTLKYLRMAMGLKDSLFSREKMIVIQTLTYKEQEKQKELAAAQIKLRNRFTLYFLLAGFTALLVIAGIVIRNKRRKQLQIMRNSIADDLHDDIGSTLSSIGIMSELAKVKSPEALHLLTSIGESTSTLQENMSDIVWTIKSGNDGFENVVRRMNLFASEILDAKNIELDFTSDAAL